MNTFRIVGIFSDSMYPTTTKKITGVLLSNGTRESINQVIISLDGVCQYYYIDPDFRKRYIESVHIDNFPSYVRSKNCTEFDTLLTLPIFYD
ncbi:DUF3892 domain-containing protein [Enterococcus sp. C76]|uniref:DUF3892 domain-containing protein n=1 Tax=Enterococcus sp. C76 TaxID=3231334 RepID=UPI002EB3306C|nr:DUF3892 domain-containing protein [Enterococcus faecium]